MRRQLDDRLENIEMSYIKMASLVEEAITDLEKSIRNEHSVLEGLRERDVEIDALYLKIEKEAVELIALQQPIAGDLRAVIALWKSAMALERLGDYSVNIGEMIYGEEQKFHGLLLMMGIVGRMLKESTTSLVEQDTDRARKTALQDEKVDGIYIGLFNKKFDDLGEDGRSEVDVLQNLFVARYLERMGDHITNICENIVYRNEGIRESYE